MNDYDLVMQGNRVCTVCNQKPRFCTDPVNHSDPDYDPDWEEDDDDG